MSHAALALRQAWETTLAEMGLTGGSILIGGPLADRIGDAVPIAIADEVASLVVLGEGPPLADDATVVATGLPDGSMHGALMLSTWRDSDEVASVVDEARRVVRSGGTVWLGRRNVDAMVESTPSALRASMLYRRHPDAVHETLATESVAPTELGLIRGGFRGIEAWDQEIPVDAFPDAAAYTSAVEQGMWLGIDLIDDAERAIVLAELADDLRGAEYPIVERQPWVLVRGTRP